jgi:hypothetical protein
MIPERMGLSDTDLDVIISALREAARLKREEMRNTIGLLHRNHLAAYAKYAADLSDRLQAGRPKRATLTYNGGH